MKKKYFQHGYWDDGTTLSGAISVSGKTWAWTGKILIAEKEYLARGRTIFAADLMSFVENFEISSDGKTWSPFWDYRATKAKPVPNK